MSKIQYYTLDTINMYVILEVLAYFDSPLVGKINPTEYKMLQLIIDDKAKFKLTSVGTNKIGYILKLKEFFSLCKTSL